MKIKIIIYNIFSFIKKISMSLQYCLENLMNYLDDKILSKFFEILPVLILSPILIIYIILWLFNWLINLLDDTFYFLPSDLRNLIRKQRKVIKNQQKDIEYLKEKLNEIRNNK